MAPKSISIVWPQPIFRLSGCSKKLKAAGLVGYITEDDDKDANRLITYENLSEQQLALIELVRKTLSDGLTSGRVRAVKSSAIADEKILGSHPTFGVLTIEDAVDAMVIDDRSVNQHPFMEANNRRTPILSTLDLVEDSRERNYHRAKRPHASNPSASGRLPVHPRHRTGAVTPSDDGSRGRR